VKHEKRLLVSWRKPANECRALHGFAVAWLMLESNQFSNPLGTRCRRYLDDGNGGERVVFRWPPASGRRRLCTHIFFPRPEVAGHLSSKLWKMRAPRQTRK